VGRGSAKWGTRNRFGKWTQFVGSLAHMRFPNLTLDLWEKQVPRTSRVHSTARNDIAFEI
jgi:hypothetical protein